MEVAANLFLIGIVFLAFAAGLPLAIFLRQSHRDAELSRSEALSDPLVTDPATHLPS